MATRRSRRSTARAPAPVEAAPGRIGRDHRLEAMKKILAVAALAALPSLALVAPRAPDVDDVVFEGGRVVDGTGAPWFVGDVAVRNGRIVAVGPLGKRAAKRRIDARGLVVAPGFIDLLGQSEYNVLVDGRAASKVTQGISSSLQYIPNIYSTTEGLTALSKVAARSGGAYFTHQRSESSRIDASLEEVFRIARDAKVRTQIWHLKTAYRPNWGKMPEVLRKIEAARAEGLDVSANQYPYNRASNGLDACLPPWVREGGRDALLKRLSDPATRERAKTDMSSETTDWENQWLGAGGAEGVMVAEVLDPKLKPYEGRTIAAIAAAEKKDPRDVVIDIVLVDR